jgi:hypothetical protein
VLLGVAEMGVDLDTHIQFVIDAMRREAAALGLAGTPSAGGAGASPESPAGAATDDSGHTAANPGHTPATGLDSGPSISAQP